MRLQIEKVLRYFDGLSEGSNFCSMFVKDLLLRSDLTIQQVKKDHYQDLQLYNLKDDPGETKNLYFKEPGIRKRLKTKLEELKKSGRSAPKK